MSVRARRVGQYPGRVSTAETLVEEWTTLPDIAEDTGVGISKVRRWVEDRAIAGFKHGDPMVFRVPTLFIDGEAPVPALKGTLILLEDAGYDAEAAIAWLFTPDDTLLASASADGAIILSGAANGLRLPPAKDAERLEA